VELWDIQKIMTNKEYIKLAQRTSKPWKKKTKIRHGVYGLVTESGELLDIFKKHDFYKKPIDYINLQEELGDIFWYLAEICFATGWTFEQIMEININKLRVRYPQGFTTKNALNRNLKQERKELEK